MAWGVFFHDEKGDGNRRCDLSGAAVGAPQLTDLGGEFLAALATAGSEDRTTGARAHTSTETVGFRAAAVVGLESTL